MRRRWPNQPPPETERPNVSKATQDATSQAATDASTSEGTGGMQLGILPTLVGRQLRMAYLRTFKDFAMEVDGTSLSPGSFEILELLSCNPGLSHSRLASAIGLEKSSLVPAIVRLEEMALVKRKQSATDKRSNELRITPKGERLLIQLRSYVVQRESEITAGMTRAEVATLNRLLTRMAGING